MQNRHVIKIRRDELIPNTLLCAETKIRANEYELKAMHQREFSVFYSSLLLMVLPLREKRRENGRESFVLARRLCCKNERRYDKCIQASSAESFVLSDEQTFRVSSLNTLTRSASFLQRKPLERPTTRKGRCRSHMGSSFMV